MAGLKRLRQTRRTVPDAGGNRALVFAGRERTSSRPWLARTRVSTASLTVLTAPAFVILTAHLLTLEA
jgi:hypothetical protein